MIEAKGDLESVRDKRIVTIQIEAGIDRFTDQKSRVGIEPRA